MKFAKDTVVRTLSRKYQLTIPKRFGKDLGLEPPAPVTVREDFDTKRIIIEALPLNPQGKSEQTRKAFIEACRRLGKKWAKLGVTEKDVEEAIREHRRTS